MKKKFLISIDTEGDNLWGWNEGEPITSENAKYLPRFQNLCNKYNFKPTYLSNYEMINDDFFVEFVKDTLEKKQCEVGMHLHAWNNYPMFELPYRTDAKPGHAYLIEYPYDIMKEKIAFITEYIQKKIEICPITHRAGRWTINNSYLKILKEFGYIVDCSVTPMMNWNKSLGQTENSCGSDYSFYPNEPFIYKDNNLIEIPVSVIKNHRIIKPKCFTFKNFLKRYYNVLFNNNTIWLRPNGRNIDDLLYMVKQVYKSKSQYLMFMLHSSEFMPGGSFCFRDEESIENLFENLEILFCEIYKLFEGMTIGDYALSLKNLKIWSIKE